MVKQLLDSAFGQPKAFFELLLIVQDKNVFSWFSYTFSFSPGRLKKIEQ